MGKFMVLKKYFTKRAWPTILRGKPSESEGVRLLANKEALINALERTSQVLDSLGPGPEALGEIAQIAREMTKTDAAQILLVDQSGDRLVLGADTNEPEQVGRVSIRTGQGLAGWVAIHRKPVALSREPWKDKRFIDYPGLDERSFQSLLCVPLFSGEELIGVINVRTRRQYAYKSSEAEILGKISGEVARAIRQQSRVEKLENTAERYEAVSEVSAKLAASPYLEEILQLLVSFTAERLNYKVVTVRLLDEARNELVLRATQSTHFAYQKKRSIQVGESFAGRAILEKKSITTMDVTSAPEYIGAELAEEQGLRAMVCVPLLLVNKAIGVMTCYTEEARAFSNIEIKTLESLAKQAAIAIEHAKLQVRSTLMQEMHHRVKNNLQQVVSLLRLQLAENMHKTIAEVINDSIGRIVAIANVHDLLSREDLDRVGMKTVALSLVAHYQQATVPPGKQIRLKVEGDDVPLSMTQATQVALILNELFQNALEHGFQRAEEGDVFICIKDKGDDVLVWVSNSGDRLPEDFDLFLDSHLGLKIVDNLARAIGGRFTIRTSYNWVVAEVLFSKEEIESL